MTHLQQIIYQSHPLTYAYLYHLQKHGVLKLDKKTAYEPSRHGLEPFGFDDIKRYHQFEIPGIVTNSNASSSDYNDLYCKNKLWIPTKKVNVPPISLDYD